MPNKTLNFNDVSLSFTEVEVFSNLNLEIKRGEFVAIVGPSGCGKTTLLNLLSGFIKPCSGTIVHGANVRTVYQHSSLLPWLTVAENILLGLRDVKERNARLNRLSELLMLIGLEDFAAHFPHQLSGGMRQKVELARTLCSEVDVLLLDEPFSSLDYLTRLRLRKELGRILNEFPRTTVLVTHDIEEAAQLADRILIFSERPARIISELKLSSVRPRSLTNPEVIAAIGSILSKMGIESERQPMNVTADHRQSELTFAGD
jgi:ABC-type nitrate/sulfonate/bicarbonate transport system ATPase subunit